MPHHSRRMIIRGKVFIRRHGREIVRNSGRIKCISLRRHFQGESIVNRIRIVTDVV